MRAYERASVVAVAAATGLVGAGIWGVAPTEVFEEGCA